MKTIALEQVYEAQANTKKANDEFKKYPTPNALAHYRAMADEELRVVHKYMEENVYR